MENPHKSRGPVASRRDIAEEECPHLSHRRLRFPYLHPVHRPNVLHPYPWHKPRMACTVWCRYPLKKFALECDFLDAGANNSVKGDSVSKQGRRW